MTGIIGCVWTVLCHGVTLRSDLLIISVASASESNYVSHIRFNCSLTEGVRTRHVRSSVAGIAFTL